MLARCSIQSLAGGEGLDAAHVGLFRHSAPAQRIADGLIGEPELSEATDRRIQAGRRSRAWNVGTLAPGVALPFPNHAAALVVNVDHDDVGPLQRRQYTSPPCFCVALRLTIALSTSTICLKDMFIRPARVVMLSRLL